MFPLPGIQLVLHDKVLEAEWDEGAKERGESVEETDE